MISLLLTYNQAWKLHMDVCMLSSEYNTTHMNFCRDGDWRKFSWRSIIYNQLRKLHTYVTCMLPTYMVIIDKRYDIAVADIQSGKNASHVWYLYVTVCNVIEDNLPPTSQGPDVQRMWHHCYWYTIRHDSFKWMYCLVCDPYAML